MPLCILTNLPILTFSRSGYPANSWYIYRAIAHPGYQITNVYLTYAGVEANFDYCIVCTQRHRVCVVERGVGSEGLLRKFWSGIVWTVCRQLRRGCAV